MPKSCHIIGTSVVGRMGTKSHKHRVQVGSGVVFLGHIETVGDGGGGRGTKEEGFAATRVPCIGSL